MYKVLQIIYPGKANLLGAAAFEYKIKKIERAKNNKRGKLMKGMSKMAISGLSDGNSNGMESNTLNMLNS